MFQAFYAVRYLETKRNCCCLRVFKKVISHNKYQELCSKMLERKDTSNPNWFKVE